MMRRAIRSRCTCATMLWTIAVLVTGSAQEKPAPVIQFGADGISLHEAVRLTLAHAPDIARQHANLQFQEGVAQEQQGVFDVVLSGQLAYEYRQQELPESRKEDEREKRTDLTDAIALSREDFTRAQNLIRQLNVVRNASPGAGQAQAVTAIDPDIGSQLQLLDLLITGQSDAAIRNELFRVRQDFITRKIGEIGEAAGIAVENFQGAEQRLADIGAAPNDEVFENGSFDVQASRRFRNGIAIAPFVSGKFEGTNYKDKQRSADFGGKGLEDLYTFRAGVSTTLPFARGRGADATAAAERAARVEVDASRLAVRHQVAASVFDTVQAYWRVKASQGAFEVARDSVGIQEQILQLTRASIDAGELPNADLARGLASEARARSRLFDAERQLHEARVALAISMGLAVSDDDRTLPRALDPYPAAPPVEGAGPASTVGFMGDAQTGRADLRSATLLAQAGQILERGARTDQRSRLDLTNDTWWTALDERTLSNAIDRWVGPSASLRLELEHPFGNHAARGRFAQRQAEGRQRTIDAQDLGRQITLSVIRTTQAIRYARGRLDQAAIAVEASQKTVDSEIERFKAGDATLIDTILTEGQLVDARLAFVSAQADLATLVAQLRFDTGTLVRFSAAQPSIDERDLTTMPRAPAPKSGGPGGGPR